MKNITVIGAGAMGSGIAHSFAQFGFEVSLFDINEEALKEGLNKISQNMDRQVKKDLFSETSKAEALSRISLCTELKEAVKNAELVVEAVSESLKIKEEIFKSLDQHCPANCILASNTSSISITRLASFTQRKERVIGMHFMNPVPIMRLVEIINGHHTSEVTLREISAVAQQLDKVPLVAQDYPGFVANRILLPMINEAIETLFQGVAQVEAIDQIMKLGMGHPLGPLRLADFIGLDVCLSVLEVMHEGFGKDKYAPCPLLKKMVDAGNLGIKTQRGFYDYSKDPKIPIPLKF